MALEAQGVERRTSLILLQYWNQLRGDRAFPDETEIDPEQLSQIWDHCFLLQIRDVKAVRYYNYTYLGSDLLRAYEEGQLDRYNGKMISPDAHRAAHLFEEVIRTGDPLIDEGEYTNPGGVIVKYRQALMPLGGPPDSGIHAVLGGAWFRLFANQPA